MRIFDVDPQTHVLLISPEIKALKWVKEILARDKGSKNDADGRKKLFATKELLYIYFHSEPTNNPFINLPESQKEEAILSEVDLPANYKPDKLILEAIQKYTKYKETVSERTLKEIKRTLESSVDTIALLRSLMEEKLKLAKETKDPTTVAEVVKMITQILDISGNIPDSIDKLSKLEEKVKREKVESEGSIRGGGTISPFEDK